MSYNGVSKSTLRYVPSVDDNGRYLTCRAENDALKNEAMEDQWTIQVHCKSIRIVLAYGALLWIKIVVAFKAFQDQWRVRVDLGFDFYQLSEDLNPGQLDEKCECYL